MTKPPSHHPPQFFLSLYGWTYWVPILLAGGLIIKFCLIMLWLSPSWANPFLWIAIVAALLTFCCLAFYRDFNRPIPRDPNIMVAPADGKVTEISQLPHYAPFNGPALKIGIFLSVLDVHVNRSPCDATVLWTRYEEGLFLDARHPDCSTQNQSNTIALGPPNPQLTTPTSEPRTQNSELRTHSAPPTAVVKQIVGAIARRIIAPVTPGERLTRGQRFGMIAFGSRTELYVPTSANWSPAITLGTHVKGGKDIILRKS